VGPSGSGKSTIVQLLERFYDPNEGQVTVDGVDIKKINLREYRRKVGYVGQEPVLFNTTIKENIRLGCPTASDEEIKIALQKSNAWEFIQKHD
jgi:ABC-type multidrug transport system fused ATPase/permease subunit